MSRCGRAAERPPEQCQDGRITRGEVGMPGSTWHVDLAVTAARGQGLAEDGIARPVETRGGQQVGVQADRQR